MKGLGNYRGVPSTPAITIERRLSQVAAFHGPRASVRSMDGATHTMPSAPLTQLGLKPGDTFVLVIEWSGKAPKNVRVEPRSQARGPAEKRAAPKVMVRDGLKLTTRR